MSQPKDAPRPLISFALARLAVAALALAASGCGGSKQPERVAVSGEVTLDGAALPTGTITFVPQGAGTAGKGQIVNGRFTIAREEGPSPGKCRVEILSYQETGRKVPGVGPGGMTAEVQQMIPAKYNAQTQLEQTLEAKGPNVCNFPLTSR